jgi:hypothetical protein
MDWSENWLPLRILWFLTFINYHFYTLYFPLKNPRFLRGNFPKPSPPGIGEREATRAAGAFQEDDLHPLRAEQEMCLVPTMPKKRAMEISPTIMGIPGHMI